MTSKKSTKRALISSALAILMCLAMLIGTTFAWFTDTASTGVNKIQAGNLDIEAEYTLDGENWYPLDEATDLFSKGLWEPGHTEVVAFKFKNAGNLALKYRISMNIVAENAGVNKAGQEYKLSDYLKVKTLSQEASLIGDITVGLAFGSRNNSLAFHAADFKDVSVLADDLFLPAGEVGNYLIMKVYMPETVGNEANAIEAEKAASIDFGINVLATQVAHENDSFGNTYDKNATYPVSDYSTLKEKFGGSGVYNVTEDVNVEDTLALTGFNALTLNATGKTISNKDDLWNTATGAWSLVSARDYSMLTITGGNFEAKANDCYAVDVQDGATVTIEDGTFVGNIHAVYVQQGTANIKGGFFSVQQKYPDAAKADEFVLNCYDANRAADTAKIIVTGGTFVNFNPADCYAEGAHTNFVADGYKVVSETKDNGDIWYTVIPE